MIKKSQTQRTKLSQTQLEAYIRSESCQSLNIVFTDHARKQMKLRKITDDLVTATLQNGKIKRTPEPNAMKGSLECRMEHYVAGVTLAVIVAICDDDPPCVKLL